uniref:NAC domain-containing protein n=1 Tax=Salix viminalis TaxID=40686 RepID=A0A6N2NG01_SALVM
MSPARLPVALQHGVETTKTIIYVSKIDKNYSVTALRKGFSYRNTQPHQPGCKWTMYEYSLPSLSEVTVLCQLRRKDNDKTHQSTQKNKKRKRAGAHGVDDAENTKSQEASETVSEDVFNGVSFEDFDSLYCENMLDFDCCEMAANSITSTTGHFSPTTVSTLNPAENFKPFEAVRIEPFEADDDLRQEFLERLNSTFFYDEVDVVSAIKAAPVQGDGIQDAKVGSTLIESFTSEVVDHHSESEVSEDSSLSSDWIQSFPPSNSTGKSNMQPDS